MARFKPGDRIIGSKGCIPQLTILRILDGDEVYIADEGGNREYRYWISSIDKHFYLDEPYVVDNILKKYSNLR